jgi:catechol 2,3-dioxygenase-like lactoylglutathione lyase family enzyme
MLSTDDMVSVRYMVDDVQAAIDFYATHFGFAVRSLAAEVSRLREAGVSFRNDIVTGPGGSQIVLEDPAGNPVELFQPARG